MATPKKPTDENVTPISAHPRFSDTVLQEFTINPPPGRGGAGFVQALCTLLSTRPDVNWTREALTAELETLTGRRPAPGTLDRILRAAIRAECLASGTRKTTGTKVWLTPVDLPPPDEMVTKVRDALIGHG
jgi:hypothetical protein